MRNIKTVLLTLYDRRHVIGAMARRELGARYAGTLGGIVWVVAQPLATVFVFWFVFSFGFKATGPSGAPFILYFLCGYVPWLFFNEVLDRSVNGVVGNSHLVKKIAFPTEVIPIVYAVVALVPHAFLVMALLFLSEINGFYISVHSIQIIYYLFCLCIFSLGVSWILAALNVFHRDVAQMAAVFLNLWFWMTPIVWGASIIPERYRWILDLNPILYVINGYRSALIYQKWDILNLKITIYYWAISAILFSIGYFVFHRLKDEFGDVL